MHPKLLPFFEQDFESLSEQKKYNLLRKISQMAFYGRDTDDSSLFIDGMNLYNELNQSFGNLIKRKPVDPFYSNLPSVVIVKEKHGDIYLNGSTAKDLSLSLLALLQQRLNDGFIYEKEVEDNDLQTDLFKPVTQVPATIARGILEYYQNNPKHLVLAGKKALYFLRERINVSAYEDVLIEKMTDSSDFVVDIKE